MQEQRENHPPLILLYNPEFVFGEDVIKVLALKLTRLFERQVV
jgi:hypothetical protein